VAYEDDTAMMVLAATGGQESAPDGGRRIQLASHPADNDMVENAIGAQVSAVLIRMISGMD
jgi:hypothetical protein